MALMLPRRILELLVLALIWEAVQPTATTGQGLQGSQVEIAYVEPRNPALRPYYEDLKRRKVLEELRQFLSPIRLPRPLLVMTAECGTDVVPYKSGTPVTVCYEYVARIVKLAPAIKTPTGISRDDAILGAFVQFILHHISLAVFDLLHIPVWGRQHDAADNVAAFVMLQFGRHFALRSLRGTVWFFEASTVTWTGSDFARETSPEAQRFYNYLCIAFGSRDPAVLEIVRDTLLKTRRAARCRREYEKLRYAFTQTILPHIDADRLRTVQSMQWLKPEQGE
jgi:hypothetical protein